MLVPFYQNNKSADFTYENNPYKWIDLGIYLNVINEKVIKDFWKMDAFNLPEELPKYEKLCEKYPPVNLQGDDFVSFKDFLISAKLLFNTGFECKYGLREKWSWNHHWIDLAMPKWTPIESFTDWKVVFAWEKGDWWKLVVIQTKEKYFCYAHLDEIKVKENQEVSVWDVIWTCGKTGNSTGYHLHFQIDKKDGPFHPYWSKNQQDIEKYCIDGWDWLRKNYKISLQKINNSKQNKKDTDLINGLANDLSAVIKEKKSHNKVDNLDNSPSSSVQLAKARKKQEKQQEDDLIWQIMSKLPQHQQTDYVKAFLNAKVIKWDNNDLKLDLPLTRYQLTLILYRIVKAGLWKLPSAKCEKKFVDIKNLDKEFYQALDLICGNWILHWDKNKFYPWNFVNWVQFLAVIGRVFDNLQDWSWNNWFKPYENWASQKWLIWKNWKYLYKPVPRKEVLEILWKLIFGSNLA